MSSAVATLVHPSRFPSQVAEQLRQCLHTRRIDPKLHYDTYVQTRAWRKVHDSYAPSRQEEVVRDFYDQAYHALLPGLTGLSFQLLGLGCGTGHKEARFLELSSRTAEPAAYFPVDISLPMVIEAYLAGHPWAESTRPIVCDLNEALDFTTLLDKISLPRCPRIVTAFGLLPQLEPEKLFASFQSFLQPGDQVLFNANLIPPGAPRQRLQAILPQYQNSLTTEWLTLFLRHLGVEESAGHVEWTSEELIPDRKYRLVAWFCVEQPVEIEAVGENFQFRPGDRWQLFFSNRYTPDGINQILGLVGASSSNATTRSALKLFLENSWRLASGEEGVYHLRAGA